LSLAVVVLTLAVCSGPAQAVTTWFDDFSDGNAEDGDPLTWTPHPAMEGDYNATSGDYIFTPGFGAGNDDSMAAAVLETSFTDVSVRTRTRTELPGNVGPIGRLDFATISGYIGLVDHGGLLILSRVEGGQVNDEFNLTFEIPELSAFEDLIVQLDIFGDTVSLSAWRPGDPQPAPQLEGTDPAFVSGTTGLVFNEDEDESAGTYYWATAASARIINGDVNFDGEVNGLDVDPFVEAVLGGGYAAPADMNGDGAVDGLDVDPFVAAVVGGGAAASPLDVADVPEPSTLLLALLALVGSACCAAGRRGRP
jgi:hypothetical protein